MNIADVDNADVIEARGACLFVACRVCVRICTCHYAGPSPFRANYFRKIDGEFYTCTGGKGGGVVGGLGPPPALNVA